MSRHHHHDNTPSHQVPYKVHHDWRFYAAGFLILFALVVYLLTGDLAWRPVPPPPPVPDRSAK